MLNRRVPFVLWFTFAAFVSILIAPAALNWRINGDMFWQRWLGAQILVTHRIPTQLGAETLSAPGAPWVAQEWLIGVALALEQREHAFAVLAGAAICAVLAVMFLCVARMRRRGATHPAFLALCAVLVGLSTVESFGIRAQVFAWPLLGLLLLLLEDGGDVVWLSILLTVLWSNVHASVMLSPVMVFLYALGTLIDQRAWTARVTRYATLVPILLLATFASPLGWSLPFYAISVEHSPIRAFITEWQPTRIADYGLWVSVAPLCAGFLVLIWRRYRLTAVEVLTTLACGYLALSASRDVPIFAIAIAPIVCAGLERAIPMSVSLDERPLERVFQLVAALIILPGLFLLSLANSTRGYAGTQTFLPVAAISHIAGAPGPKRLFCYDFAACSLALGRPNFRVFMDGRADPFPKIVWERYRTIVQVRHGWERLLDEYGINFVLAPDDTNLAGHIGQSVFWSRIYDQNGNSVFERHRKRMGSRRNDKEKSRRLKVSGDVNYVASTVKDLLNSRDSRKVSACVMAGD